MNNRRITESVAEEAAGEGNQDSAGAGGVVVQGLGWIRMLEVSYR